MKQPVAEAILSIDFSLDQLDVALQGADQAWLWPHRSYENNWLGFQELKKALLAELEADDSSQLTAVGESTGPYWWHTFYQLSHDADLAVLDPQLVLYNPAHVKQYRRALPEKDKTDLDDTHLIHHYYQAVGCKHPYHFYDRYLPLRPLTRAYSRLIHTLAAEKAFFLSVLYLTASEYQRQGSKPFSNLFGVTSSYVLDEFADIAAIADIPLAELAALLAARSGHTLPDPTANADKLLHVARASYPLPSPLAAAWQHVLQHTLAHLRFLSDKQTAYRQAIAQQLDALPEAQLALDFKGLGPILVAGCLAEIQDTARFTSGLKFDRQLKRQRPRTYRDGQAAVANLAGLWWPRHDSGRLHGQHRALARERNTYLRFWLVQAANTLRRYQPDYAAFYRRKFAEASHHQHKRALILTARKAVRLIFALLHKGQQAALKEGLLT